MAASASSAAPPEDQGLPEVSIPIARTPEDAEPPFVGEWQEDVLPIFYYNDMLVSRPGDAIGLNLFEPRYKEMCRRMTRDPRFLFLPNFEDYGCRIGDVGFVVRLVSLQEQRGGQYSIRGFAQSLAAVRCTWAEVAEGPGQPLHFAQIWALDHALEGLSIQELAPFWDSLRRLGWRQAPSAAPRPERVFPMERQAAPQHGRLLMELPGVDGARLLFGLNWPEQVFLMAPTETAAGPPPVKGPAEEAWAATVPMLPRPRFDPAEFVARAVHQVAVPAPGNPTLVELCAELLLVMRADCPEARALAGLPAEGPPDEAAWRELLSEARICGVGGMSAWLPTARVRLRLVGKKDEGVVTRYLPRCTPSADGPRHVAAMVGNGTNICFFAWPELLEVLAASAAAASAALRRRLNFHRVALLRRARDAGVEPLAALTEIALHLVCDFIGGRLARQ